MATWTTLPDATLEPGKPIRSIDVLALRDNPIAIAEGENGAPRIWGKAAKRLSTYPVLTVSAADAFDPAIGSNPEVFQLVVFSGPLIKAASWTIQLYTGSMRFRASHNSSGSNSTVTMSLFKNNVLVQSFTTNSVTPVNRAVDLLIIPGDVVEWRHGGNALATSTVTAIGVTASNAYQIIPFYIAASDL